MLHQLLTCVLRLKIWNDSCGQDFIEYSLMAGFVAVSAAVISPNISVSISTIFSTVGSVMTNAAS